MIRSLLCLALLLSSSFLFAAEPEPAKAAPPLAKTEGDALKPGPITGVGVNSKAVVIGTIVLDADPAAEQAAREAAFAKLMSGATLDGQFTARDRADGKIANDKYTLGKVSKIAGEKDLWNFETRIQYGKNDLTVPLAVRVVWSGDTPVITVDDLAVPGLGKFTARVMVFHEQYTGMWDGAGNHGGLMFGKVVPAKPAGPAEKK